MVYGTLQQFANRKPRFLQTRPYAQAAYGVPNGAGAPAGPPPGAAPLLPNQGRIIQQGPIRVLCIADVRGKGILIRPGFEASVDKIHQGIYDL